MILRLKLFLLRTERQSPRKTMKRHLHFARPLAVAVLAIAAHANAGELTEQEKAQFSRGYQHFESAEYSDAVSAWLPLARRGNVHVQMSLTAAYEKLGGTENRAKALDWYRAAAEQGHPEGQLHLAAAYARGDLIDRDMPKAVQWWERAAKQGNVRAQIALGYVFSQDPAVNRDYGRAAYWYRRAAEAGDASAQNALGYMYEEGLGVKVDPAQAVHWYTQAANAGNAESQLNLGYLFSIGKGVKKDRDRAIHWYTAAANQGDARAQFNLAMHYLNKRGTGKPDHQQGLRWLRLSAAQGFERAEHAICVEDQKWAKETLSLACP